VTNNISQSTLANALGVSLQQMQKYENGINRVGASRLHQIAKVLQIPIASFFDAPGESRSSHRASAISVRRR
jgi:transcriptional regulator with XRE-family HTH domain